MNCEWMLFLALPRLAVCLDFFRAGTHGVSALGSPVVVALLDGPFLLGAVPVLVHSHPSARSIRVQLFSPLFHSIPSQFLPSIDAEISTASQKQRHQAIAA